jgi:glycosyltransferase involved in cell wall biosynthesis
MNPLISIILPVKNAGAVLETTLESIRRQTYPHIETIIIDGLSVDGTPDIIETWHEISLKIKYKCEPDTGVYDAMNKGLDMATGDWLYFMGAGDEFYHDDILSELVNEGHLQGERIVYGSVHIRGDVGWAKDDNTYDGAFDLIKLLHKNICHQSIFYPLKVAREIGSYNQRYYVTADWDYNLRCWAKYPFHYVDKIIAWFIAGGVSSNAGDREFGEDRAGNVIRYFGLDPWSPEFDKPGSPFYYLVLQYRETMRT